MPTLEFKGKQHIYAHHLSVPYRPLIPDESKSVTPFTPPQYKCSKINPNTPESQNTDSNLIIHGDNLHALKALLPAYAGRIKCIYIDPPYNTGNENWIYNDRVNSPLMREWLDKNSPIDGEDLERHDKWLCMMWPRLQLLRELLADDGVIFISIDDNEQHRLRAIMDEIFGEDKFIVNVSWERRRSRSNDSHGFTISNEFILVYGEISSISGLEYDQHDLPSYSNSDPDGRRYMRMSLRMTGGANTRELRPNLYYGLEGPDGETVYPKLPNGDDGAWRWSEERVKNNPSMIEWRKGRNGWVPYTKIYAESNKSMPARTMWTGEEVGTNTDATRAYREIFPTDPPFPTCKPVGIIDRMLRIATGPNDIVLDSFAGSGTTAHAVLQLNKEDGGDRKFILVECEDYADNITAERVRRVITGVPDARDAALREGLGGSFTYCTLGKPITMQGMLNGQNLPEYSSLASYLLHCATGMSVNPNALATNSHTQNDETGFFYESEHVRYHLLYKQDIEWLRDDKGALNYDRAKIISKSAKKSGKSAVVFAPMRYMSQSDLTSMHITFCQLPYELTASRAQALEA